MKRKSLSRILAGTLAAVQLFALSGCQNTANPADTAADFRPVKISAEPLSSGTKKINPDTVEEAIWQSGELTVNDFSIRLLQQNLSQNILLSPFSALYALTMTLNGADGNTLRQMEEVLGEEQLLNGYLPAVSSSAGDQLHMANSIWYRDTEGLRVKEDFLKESKAFYDTALYKAPFDQKTLDDINHWVYNETDGMIENILDDISDDAMMYLINALSFDAKWKKEYKARDIKSRSFTLENGTKQNVQLMYSDETDYLSCENAEGFLRDYEGGRYAFAALLPEEGLKMEEFIASLDGEKLTDILNTPLRASVHAAIPKFTAQYNVNLIPALTQMGITDAFSPESADFSRMGDCAGGPLYIYLVKQKTYIELEEKGTKAAAATMVGVASSIADDTSALTKKEIILDRPFLYMIIDTRYNIPVFIGTMMGPQQ